MKVYRPDLREKKLSISNLRDNTNHTQSLILLKEVVYKCCEKYH